MAGELGTGVTYIATGVATDPEMSRRFAHHKNGRPSHWRTIEETTNLIGAVRSVRPPQTVIIDCLGFLVNNVFGEELDRMSLRDRVADPAFEPPASLEESVESRISEQAVGLIEVARAMDVNLLIVTNEVGCGVVPEWPLGRLFRDSLGKVNRTVASLADEVFLMICGIPLRIKPMAAVSAPFTRS